MTTKLSVNINKVALVRNSRGANLPDLRQFAIDCEKYGAQGITVHPRPDERHVRYDDLPILKEVVTTELNIEGYPSDFFVKKVLTVIPHQCTLVPDLPGVLTSNEGWKPKKNAKMLEPIINKMKNAGIRVSLFLDPIEKDIYEAKEIGADRIEFYTGRYASEFNQNKKKAISAHISAAHIAETLSLGINAGHDLNLDNLAYYKENIPSLLEVSIGHALISDALYFGIQNVIGMYRNKLS
ncbi:MAG: pyridoxine 5'-phosphate synthase [Saprospiraceae bacterium]